MAPIFDPDVLHAIARDALETPMPARIDAVVSAVRARYPDHIDENPRWVLNNAGGAMGAMLVLHASLTEYVIVFGTPVGTEGHSGRFAADDWFMILDGEQWAFSAGELSRRVYRPGDRHHMAAGAAQAYRIPDRCWALEYARGNVAAMMPFGVADTLFSTLDFRTLAETFSIYGRLSARALLKRLRPGGR